MSDLGNKKIFSENLKYYMQQKNISRPELSKALDVSYTTVASWETGTNYPRIDKIEMLANFFGISKADLIEKRRNKNVVALKQEITTSDYYFVPEPISAGMPIEIGAMEQLPTVSIPDCMLGKYAHSRHILIMPINGESMNKIIPNNSYIAVNTDISADDLKDGDIVVFAVNGDYAVKQFYDGGDVYIFRPASHDVAFRDCVVAKENADTVKVIGKVVMYNILLD